MDEESKEVTIEWETCLHCKILTPMAKFTLPGLEDKPRYRCLNCLKLFERKLVRRRQVWPL